MKRRDLERVLSNLKDAQAYLLSPEHLVCMVLHHPATTTDDYTNTQGKVCTAVNKEYGSPLAQLHTAIRDLDRMLHPATKP